MCNNLEGVFPTIIGFIILGHLFVLSPNKVAKGDNQSWLGKHPVDCCTCLPLKYKRFSVINGLATLLGLI